MLPRIRFRFEPKPVHFFYQKALGTFVLHDEIGDKAFKSGIKLIKKSMHFRT
jgi:hypothetical protein